MFLTITNNTMAIGKTASFATDAPLSSNYVGDALADTERNGFLYRKERRDIAEAKKAEEEAKQNEIKTGFGSIEPAKMTKFTSLNALASSGARLLYEDVVEKGRLYSQGKIPKIEYEIALQNAKGQMSQINQKQQIINDQVANYSKLIEKGDIAKGFEKNAMELGKSVDNLNMFFEKGKDGVLQLVSYDDTGKILEKNSIGKFGENAFTPVMNFDIDKDKAEFIKTYPKVLTERLGATSKTGIKGITPEIQEAVKIKVNDLVNNSNSLAIANYKRTGVPNAIVTDPKEIEATSKMLEEEYLAMYSPEKTVDEATQRARFNEDRRIQRKKEEETMPVIGTGTITSQGGTVAGQFVPRGTKNFAISKAERKFGDGKVEKLKQVRVLPDGNLGFEVEETYEGKSTTGKVINQAGRNRLKTINPETKKRYTEAELFKDDFDNVTATSKKPVTRFYNTKDNADDSENYAIMLINPETGENFSGLNQARDYFNRKAKSIDFPKQKQKNNTQGAVQGKKDENL